MSFTTGTSDAIFSDPVNKRLIGGVLLSMLLHALVLSLQYGIPGLGLPGLELPWKERRATLAPISIQIANSQKLSAPAPLPRPQVIPVPAAPTPDLKHDPLPLANAGISVLANLGVGEAHPAPKKISAKQKNAPVVPLTRLARPSAVPAEVITPVIAQDQIRDENFVMPLLSPEEPEQKLREASDSKKKSELHPAETQDQTPLSETELAKPVELEIARELAKQVAAAQILEKQLAAKKIDEENHRQAQLLAQQQLEESARRQADALALQKKQAAEQQALRLQQQDAARLEALRLDEVRRQEEQRKAIEALEQRKHADAQEKLLTATRQRLAEELAAQQKVEQQKVEQQKVEQQKVEQQKAAELAARQKSEQLAAQRAAEQRAAEQRAAEQRAAEQKAAEQKAQATSQAEGKANPAAASVSRNGDATAAGGSLVLPKGIFSSDLANRAREQQSRGWDALSGSSPVQRQADAVQQSRRRSILGNFDREVPLRMYVESWRQKVERNGNFNYSQTAKDKARGDPVVIVAIRSDGSVEDITIVRSSGRADLDEAVSRIVRLNAPYAVFPQNIAAKYDVIEIRRVWRFDETLRIVEEVR